MNVPQQLLIILTLIGNSIALVCYSCTATLSSAIDPSGQLALRVFVDATYNLPSVHRLCNMEDDVEFKTVQTSQCANTDECVKVSAEDHVSNSIDRLTMLNVGLFVFIAWIIVFVIPLTGFFVYRQFKLRRSRQLASDQTRVFVTDSSYSPNNSVPRRWYFDYPHLPHLAHVSEKGDFNQSTAP
ncbi:hypothetical protein FO519_005084 [Halicephalobus sp. NKZ332]|nr:hypothetical protein FO519_005084 [Halicephalobus sp. NKZ332]